MKIWQEQLRTIKHDVESKFKKRIEADSVLLSCLIQYITGHDEQVQGRYGWADIIREDHRT